MNHLLQLPALSNRYFAMRHGRSLANLEGIIVSDPGVGIDGYGLSDPGRAHVESTLHEDKQLDSSFRILCSDFRRARETAEIAHRLLECETSIEFDLRLRERWFGDIDLGPDSAYADVWQADASNPDSEHLGAESVNRVLARTTSLVRDLETRFQQSNILLVSHGDALQILQTAFAGQSASQHRNLPHLETAEIRCFKR